MDGQFLHVPLWHIYIIVRCFILGNCNVRLAIFGAVNRILDFVTNDYGRGTKRNKKSENGLRMPEVN
jgi:hypothetical protein